MIGHVLSMVGARLQTQSAQSNGKLWYMLSSIKIDNCPCALDVWQHVLSEVCKFTLIVITTDCTYMYTVSVQLLIISSWVECVSRSMNMQNI